MLLKPSLSFSLLAAWLSFKQGRADEAATFNSTIQSTGEVEYSEESLKNQFIIQFESNEAGERSKQSVLSNLEEDNDNLKVISRIESRNIAVVKFRNKWAALKWQKGRATVIKYFEKGEEFLIVLNCVAHFHNTSTS